MRRASPSAARLLGAWIIAFLAATVPTVVLAVGPTASASPPNPTYGTATVDGNDGEWSLASDYYAPLYLAGDQSKGTLANGYLRYDCTSGTVYVLVLQASSSDPIGTSSNGYGGNAWAEIDGGSAKQYTDSDTTNAGNTPPEFAWVGLNYDGSGDAQGYEASFAIAPGNHTIVVHAEVLLSGSGNTAAFLGFGAHPAGTVGIDIPSSCTNGGGSSGSGGGAAPAISLVKDTNGSHYSSAPGAVVAVGSAVDWTYLVTNTGNVDLSSVGVTDDQGVTVSCGSSTLAAGSSETCTGSGVATAGQYHNTATASGTYGSTVVTAQDQSWYFGAAPAISLVKDTNGSHYSSAPGAVVAVGSAVDWTYLVTNTGDVDLSSVGVIDDQGVTVSCGSSTLAAGSSETCTGSGVATAGQYHNTATASGTYGSTVVTAQDQSWYFGAAPAISLVKDTNGSHYSSAPGAVVAVGSAVDWTYLVTNTGNVDLSSVGVTDDQGVTVSCGSSTLAAGSSETCTGSGVATAGQYHNTATASGTYGSTVVTAQDQSWYDGMGDPVLAGPTPKDPASTPYTRTYAWSINKTASGPTYDPSSQSDSYGYDVMVTETGYSDSDFVLNGVVTLTNTNNQPLTGVTVTDAVDNGGTCQVADGVNLTIAASSAVTLDYTCSWTSAPSALSGNDTATAVWDPSANHTPTSSTEVVTPFAFGNPSATIDKTITVTDSMNGQLGTLAAVDAQPYTSRDFTYTVAFPAPASGCQNHPNTAALSETGQSVTVTVCAPSGPPGPAPSDPPGSSTPSDPPGSSTPSDPPGAAPSDPPGVAGSTTPSPGTPADPVQAAAHPGSKPLPFTGNQTLRQVGIAGLLILAGTTFLAASESRRLARRRTSRGR